MRISVLRNTFHVHLNIMICTSRILLHQKRTMSKYIATSKKQRHSPSLSIKTWRNFSTTCSILTTANLTNYLHTWLLVLFTIGYSRLQFWVWYVSFTCLSYSVLLSLGDLPRVALLLILVHHMPIPPPIIPPTAYDSMHTTRNTKYYSRSPFLQLNITIVVKVIRWYYS